jgi:hypothetical protein
MATRWEAAAAASVRRDGGRGFDGYAGYGGGAAGDYSTDQYASSVWGSPGNLRAASGVTRGVQFEDGVDVQELLKHEACRDGRSREERGTLVEPIDTREVLKAIAFDSKNPRCDSHFEKSRPCPTDVYGVSDQFLVLDSAQAVHPGLWNVGQYKFNFAPQRAAGDQVVGIRDVIETTIQLAVAPFCIPLPLLVDVDEAGPTLTLTPNPGATDPRANSDPVDGARSQLAHCSRVTLYFPELGEQSFFDFKSRRHHFEFDATVVGTVGQAGARMKLTPVSDLSSVYTFTDPIRDIHGLTAQFYSPDQPLRLPPDEIHGVTLVTTGASVLQIVAPATRSDGVALSFSDLLEPGDRVYLDNVTIDPTVATTNARELSAYLNKPDGLFVGAVGTITATTFLPDPNIDPGLGASVSVTSTTPIRLRIAKNRLRIPLRCRCVKPRLTNYIVP